MYVSRHVVNVLLTLKRGSIIGVHLGYGGTRGDELEKSPLEEPVPFGLPYCYKWYIVPLGRHGQNSIYSLHPIMVVTVPHTGLSILALQSPCLSLVSVVFISVHHFLSSFCPIFHIFVVVSYLVLFLNYFS